MLTLDRGNLYCKPSLVLKHLYSLIFLFTQPIPGSIQYTIMSIFSSRSQLLPNLAGFLGAAPLGIGISGLLRPSAVLASVNFPAPTTPEAQKLANALTRLFAARNIVISLICLAVWHRGDRKLLGWAMVIVSFYPLVDTLVSLDLIEGGLWYHLPVVPIALGLGAGLLGWLG